jgi:hypothetical protein
MNDQENDRSWFTFIFSLVAFICLMTWVVWPHFIPTSRHNPATACINYLRQLDGAVQQWALENKMKPEDLVTLSNAMQYINPGNRIECPSGGKYTVGPAVSNLPTCSVEGHTLPP